MEEDKMQELIQRIQKNLGEETAGLIADDLGIIVTSNTSLNNKIAEKEKEIEKLNTQNTTLLKANGNLLQQVSFSNKNQENTNNNDKDKEISFDDIFDEKGNFK